VAAAPPHNEVMLLVRQSFDAPFAQLILRERE
jgi:hypothetical protein